MKWGSTPFVISCVYIYLVHTAEGKNNFPPCGLQTRKNTLRSLNKRSDENRCWVSTVYFEDGSNPPWIAVLSRDETNLLAKCVAPNDLFMSCYPNNKEAHKFKRELLRNNGPRRIITPAKLHKIARRKNVKH